MLYEIILKIILIFTGYYKYVSYNVFNNTAVVNIS